MVKENAFGEGVLFAVPDDPSEHQGTIVEINNSGYHYTLSTYEIIKEINFNFAIN